MNRQFDRKLRMYCAAGSATATMLAAAAHSQGQIFQGNFSHNLGGNDSGSIQLTDAYGQSFLDTGDDSVASDHQTGTDGNTHTGAHLYLSNKFQNYKGSYLYTGSSGSGSVTNLALGTVIGPGNIPTGTTFENSETGTDNDIAYTDSTTGMVFTPSQNSASTPTQFSILTTGYYAFNIQPSQQGGQTDYGYASITFDSDGDVAGTYAYNTGGGAVTVAAFPVSYWQASGSGDYSNGSNWVNSVPGGVGSEADFGNFANNSGGATVNIASPVVLSTVRFFNKSVSYTLSGAGSLNLNSSTGTALIVNEQGNQTIGMPVTFVSAGAVNISSGANNVGNALNFNAPLTFDSAGAINMPQTGSGVGNDAITINGPLTFNGSGALNVLQASSGENNSLNINAPLTFNGGGSIQVGIYASLTVTGATTVAAGKTLSVNSGSYYGDTPALISFGAFNVGNGASVSCNYTYAYGAGVISMSSLTLGAGSSATLTGATAGSYSNGNASIGKLVLQLGGVSLAPTSKIDLQSNDLVIQGNTSLAAITAAVAKGYNAGNWNGASGITSSTAAADTTHLSAIGVIENSTDGSTQLYGGALGSFDGISPNATDILVRYTYFGDANLDGQVDGSDYSLIDNGALMHLTGWYNGDFNYDGVVNGSDYTLIDNSYNTQGANLVDSPAGPAASVTAEIAGTAAVPEPASLSLIAMGAVGLLRRKRV